jgi:hypothetical protein
MLALVSRRVLNHFIYYFFSKLTNFLISFFLIKALDFFCLSPQQAAGYYDKKFAAQTAESLKTVAPQAAGN